MSTKQAKVTEPVVFRSSQLNTTFQVNQGASEINDPAAQVHPDVKEAVFMDGVYQTDDAEIIRFLDKLPTVWRADDLESELKAKYGPGEVERMRKIFGTPPSPAPEKGEEIE